MNLDEMLIIRKADNFMNRDLLLSRLNRGFSLIGKPYDFNFDVSTVDKIVCSELIFIVFGNVHWPTQYRLGRPTITPDNIAEIIFQKNSKFKFQSFISGNNKGEVEKLGIDFLAEDLDYQAQADLGFKKKFTKCYDVKNNIYDDSSLGSSNRVCETSYVEYSYEESTN
jgi:hypothetical protein